MWTWIFGWFWWLIEQIRGAWYWTHGGLFNTAQRRAEELAARGDLDGHAGFWSVSWPADCPHGYYGEVIGRTNGSEYDVMNLWLQSPSHYAALVNPVYNAIGYGLARAGEMLYMVVHTALCW